MAQLTSEKFFMAASKKINADAEIVAKYRARVDSAIKFAEGATGAEWNGMFMMGLALAGLELIPVGTLIDLKFYWALAPSPSEDAPDDWPPSYIVESDAFNGT